jgi:hypothetical protein
MWPVTKVRDQLLDLHWMRRQPLPGNMRFRGANAGLWTNRAHNFLRLVRSCVH